MWLGITDITTFVVGTIIIVLLPGPNSLYVMTVASRQGVAQGYRGAMGIVVGDTVLMLLSVLGVAGVLKAFPAVFVVLQYAGAAYLAWLGVQLCRAGWRSGANKRTVVSPCPARSGCSMGNPLWPMSHRWSLHSSTVQSRRAATRFAPPCSSAS